MNAAPITPALANDAQRGSHCVQRIVRKRVRGWKMPENTISVTRPGPWGNPYKVTPWLSAPQAVAKFANALYYELNARKTPNLPRDYKIRWMADHLSDLRGKNLACYCKAGAMCHAEILLKLANDTLCREAGQKDAR